MGLVRRHTHTARINDLNIDVYRLHTLTEHHPTETVALAEFDDEMDRPCWSKRPGHDDHQENKVSPRFVVDILTTHGPHEAARRYPELRHHFDQIRTADTSYPIHVYRDHVVDGMHRLAQLHLGDRLGLLTDPTVVIKRLSAIPHEAIIK